MTIGNILVKGAGAYVGAAGSALIKAQVGSSASVHPLLLSGVGLGAAYLFRGGGTFQRGVSAGAAAAGVGCLLAGLGVPMLGARGGMY